MCKMVCSGKPVVKSDVQKMSMFYLLDPCLSNSHRNKRPDVRFSHQKHSSALRLTNSLGTSCTVQIRLYLKK